MEDFHRPIEILLVEDNEADIVLTKNAFKTLTIQNNLNVCRNGEEGLNYLFKVGEYSEATTPDLVLLDLNMPKTNGLEVLEKIKKDPKLSMVPVIVLTTSSAEQDILRSYQYHANSYIKKPIDFMEFIDVIKEIESYWFSIVKMPTSI